MKKIILLIGAILLAGSAAAVSLAKSSNNIEEVKAIDYETITGLYERIEDPSLVTPGTQVVLATNAGYVFEGIGGNPGYAHATPSGALMFEDNRNSNDDTKFLYIKNKVVSVLDVYAGYEEGTVSFKSNFVVDGRYEYYHYLAANSENYYDGGMKDYDSMAWFLDSFGMSKKLNANSSWRLQYDSENKKMLIRNCSSNDATTYISYSYNGARHHFNFNTDYYSNVNLYRLVDPSKIERQISAAPTHDPDITTYHKGDMVSFDGLVVTFGIRRDEETLDLYDLAYSTYTSQLFSSPVTIYDENTSYIEVRIFEVVHTLQYIYNVTIVNNASHHVFNKIDTIPYDLRGTYLLTDSRPRVFDPSRNNESTFNYYDSFSAEEMNDFNNGVITINYEDLDACIIRIARTKIGNSYYYHALDYSGRYICLGSQVDELDEYYLDHTDSASASNAVTLEKLGNYIFLKMGDYYYCNSDKNKLISFNKIPNYDSGFLFKLSSSTESVANQVNSFITFFEKQTEVCKEQETYSTLPKISDELWNTIKNKFNELGVDAQGIFASTTYIHGTSELATKENVVDRYDYIVSKYNHEDFMCRKYANTWQNNVQGSNISIVLKYQESYTPIIILILVALSLSATMIALIIKRRKYN